MRLMSHLIICVMQEDKEPEIWKPIPEYEGLYEISSWGNVKSLGRWVRARGLSMRFNPSVILSINYTALYPQICLSKRNSKKTYRVHVLMGKVFFSDVDVSAGVYIINHKDLDKKNNYLLNLEVINRRENSSHYHIYNDGKTSIFVGVSFDKSKPKKPWVASIFCEGKTRKLGNFVFEKEAYEVYINFLKEKGLTNKYATENQEKS